MNDSEKQLPDATGRRRATYCWATVIVFGIATLLALWIISPLAGFSVLIDGVLALGIVTGATGIGLVAVIPFAGPRGWPLRWSVIAGSGLGLGGLAVAVLGLGHAGALHPVVWWSVLGIGGVLGAMRMGQLRSREHAETASAAGPVWMTYAWLALVPAAVLVLACATVPPGILWAEEAQGYDVQEYHLQVPREYYDQGAITALPHNLYSYFPMNAEMLYLLAMVLRGGPLQAAILAKLLNAALAALFVGAAWLAGREFSRACGLVCGLLAGTAPWLAYLSGVAYVENGMLLMGMLATAALLRATRSPGTAVDLRLCALAGVFAGLACGFKYIAVPMIVGGLLAALLVVRSIRPPDADVPDGVLRGGMLFVLCAVAAFGPWMVRNVALAANPVFPLCTSWIGSAEGLWTPALAERWQRGHTLEARHDSFGGRARLLWQRVIADGRLGWLTWLWVWPILLSRRREPWDVALLALGAVQLVVWIGFTHLFARFSVLLLIPMLLLAARSLSNWPAWLGLLGTMAATITGLAVGWMMWAGALLLPNGEVLQIHGMTETMIARDGPLELPAYVRHDLPPEARVLLVAEARAYYFPQNVDYCVVFSRCPFVEQVASAESDQQVAEWLRSQGYTHVVVSWNELQRLRRSYGFSERINLALFERLVASGEIAIARQFSVTPERAYATCFRVRPTPQP